MEKLHSQTRSPRPFIAHIVVPVGDGDCEHAEPATSFSFFAASDLGPMPQLLEFENQFWNKIMVSLEDVSFPSPERVWIRPSPFGCPATAGGKIEPNLPAAKTLHVYKRGRKYRNFGSKARQRNRLTESSLTSDKDSGLFDPAGPSNRVARGSPSTIAIPVFYNYDNDVRSSTRQSAGSKSFRSQMELPAHIDFQDAFWGKIQVSTATLNEMFTTDAIMDF